MIASRSWWPFLAAVVVSGCFKTTIRSGYPPDDPPQQWEDRWHSGWLLGAIEASGPHDLSRACPGGWSQIDTVTDPSQSLITLLTIGIYTPQTVTVVCAVKPSPALSPPPPREL